MNRRENFDALANHRRPERVLVDYGKHIGSFHRIAYQRLKEHLGLALDKEIVVLDKMAQNVVIDEEICRRLGLDFRWLVPNWVNLQATEYDDGNPGYIDMWHTPFKFTPMGNYFAIHDYPLGGAMLTQADIDNFDWPDPDNPAIFEGLREQAKRWHGTTDFVIGADGIKVGLLQTALQLRGYDKFFIDLALTPHEAHALLDKLSELFNRMYANYMKEVGEFVQLVVITDDQGTQKSLMISPSMFRTFLKPRLKLLTDTIKQHTNAKVLMHCDGAIDPIMEDIIEAGVDFLNPVQPVLECFKDTAAVKAKYGDRLGFHAAIDVQQVMPNATPDSIRTEVARRIADLGPNGGYILAPCHNINIDIDPAVTVAMFDAAREFSHS